MTWLNESLGNCRYWLGLTHRELRQLARHCVNR